MLKDIISVYKPAIKRKDLENVLQSMILDRINYGEFAKNFEKKLYERVNFFNAIAINSFQNAISLVIDSFSLKEGDEIILPSFAPQVYLNTILLKKLTPVLVDLEEGYFQPSLESIRDAITNKTKLIFLLYYFGYTYDSTPYYHLFPNIVEDITSVIGAKSNNIIVGSQAKYAIADFSIKGIITTGEGGAIFCNNRKSYYTIKGLIETDYSLEYYTPRYACLMPDLNAAMGISQDETLNHRLKLREAIAKFYEDAVSKSRNSIIYKKEDCDRFYSEFPLIVKSGLKDAIAFLKKNKIEAIKPYPYCLHHYLNLPKEDFPNTEYFYLHTLLIPIHSTLLKNEVTEITKVLSCMI